MEKVPTSSQPYPPGISRRTLLAGAPLFALSACQEATNVVVPDIARPALAGLTSHTGWAVPGFHEGMFRHRVTLLNVWASWCGYCRGEHGLLKTLESRLGAPLFGLVHMDKPHAASAYLREAGNPFRSVATDPDSRMARALGQRGVPATFVIGHDGKVQARWGGGLNEDGITQVLRPAIAAARQRHLAAVSG